MTRASLRLAALPSRAYLGTHALNRVQRRCIVLIRFVRMTFRTERIETFLALFDEAAPRIRAYPGCCKLILLQDLDQDNVLTTVSHWDDDAALQRYRSSAFFRSTWARTRPLFAAPAEATSHATLRKASDSGRA